MEDALRLTKGLSFAIKTVELLSHESDQTSTALPFFGEPAKRERLNKAALDTLVLAASPKAEIPKEQVMLCVKFWSRFDNAAAKAWLSTFLINRSALTAFLESVVSTSEGTGGTKRFIFVVNFEDLISVEDLELRVFEYLAEELLPEEAELRKLFGAGLKRWRAGRDYSALTWHDEDESD